MPIEPQRFFNPLQKGVEDIRTSLREAARVNRSRKVLSLTRDLMQDNPLTPEVTHFTEFMLAKNDEHTRAVYRLIRAQPSHGKIRNRYKQGLASFITYELVARRAKNELTKNPTNDEYQQVADFAKNGMYDAAFLLKYPTADGAYKSEAKQLADHWAALSLSATNSEIFDVHSRKIATSLEEALGRLILVNPPA